MASYKEKCIFCDHDTDAWCFEDSTYVTICDLCISVVEEACKKYNKVEDGSNSKQCDNCGRQVHCGSIVPARDTSDSNEPHGIICEECLNKGSLTSQAAVVGASSSIPSPIISSMMNDSSSSSGNFKGGNVDLGAMTFLNNDPQNLRPKPPGLTFLFEKKLSPSDCSLTAGRLLLPKLCAETFLPMPPGQNKIPLVVRDTEGQVWKFNFRWWMNKRSRKYVIDGIRKCIRKMKWTAGDTLKFYRQLPDGELVMELLRTNAISPSTSTSESRHANAMLPLSDSANASASAR